MFCNGSGEKAVKAFSFGLISKGIMRDSYIYELALKNGSRLTTITVQGAQGSKWSWTCKLAARNQLDPE